MYSNYIIFLSDIFCTLNYLLRSKLVSKTKPRNYPQNVTSFSFSDVSNMKMNEMDAVKF